MKRILYYMTVCCIGMLLWTGCGKNQTILPPREISEEVSAIAERYDKVLKDGGNWILAYKPEQYAETVYIKLGFSGERKANVLAGYRGFHEEQVAAGYDYEGTYIPVIIFAENTVFGELASKYNGSVKFKVKYNDEEGYFELSRADGYDNKIFHLIKATPALEELLNNQVDDILEQIAYEEEQARLSEETRLKIEAFAKIESDFYFYNLKTENFAAAINSFDTAARTISLTYKQTPLSAPTAVTVGYSIYPQGIKLTPAIAYGDVAIEEIALGELKYEDADKPLEPTGLEILSAGSTGAGEMGYAHEAPYAYTSSTNRSQTLADYFLNEYTSSVESTARYGPKVVPEMESFRDYIRGLPDFNPAGRHLYIIYAPQFTTVGLRNLFWVASSRRVNSTSAYANMGFNVRVAMENLGDNKMNMNQVVQQTNVSVTNNIPDISSKTQEYLDRLTPAEGVTLVPFDMANAAGEYRLRLVSTVDSRFWIEFRWPSAYANMIFN